MEVPHKRSALIVDDNKLVRKLLQKILHRAGWDHDLAENGLEALEKLRERPGDFDLVITDIVMPEMDGATLVKTIAEELPRTKVLMVSGYAEDHLVRENLRVDGHRFLAKPFTEDDLLAEIDEMFA